MVHTNMQHEKRVFPKGDALSCMFIVAEVNTHLKPLAQRSATVALQIDVAGCSLCSTEVI